MATRSVKRIGAIALAVVSVVGLAACDPPRHGTLCARGIPCPPDPPKPAYGPTRGGPPPTFPWNR
jgi:hypothetical protein